MPDERLTRNILIVEDSDDDFEAAERALQQSASARWSIRRCHNGTQAWEYLSDFNLPESLLSDQMPDLMLLDLNMPGLDGRKLLARIKTDESLRRIPVVVMTTSNEQSDVQMCYQAGANSFVQKPHAWNEFCDVMSRLQDYWFQVSTLPVQE